MQSRMRWLTVVGVLGMAFLGGAVSHWMLTGRSVEAQEEAKVVRAQAVVIVDAEGNERCVLGVLPKAVGLTIKDAQGKERLTLGATSEGGTGLSLNDTAGKQRIGLGFDAEGSGLFLLDSKGVSRVDVGLAPDGSEGGLSLNGANGKSRGAIGMGKEGVGLSLRDDNGVERLGAGLGPGGGGDFVAKDADGNDIWRALGNVAQRLPGAARQPGEAENVIRAKSVVLVDDEGKERGVLGVLPDGAQLVLRDTEGRPRMALGEAVGEATAWSLILKDGEGRNRFACGAQVDGEGSGMGIWDWNGTLRFGLGAERQGCGLVLNNEEGKEIIGVGVGSGGGGGDLFLRNPGDGREVWRASRTPQNPPEEQAGQAPPG